ncbi:HD domain-containing protein [uncultured Tateyamaria sp.]|uniref:HD domain-containing protein n=1 Tax=uncultured Tateyamaria sp. TaxID=455651 RepID=UPI002617DF9F|nr:peptidase [uncultured Tateyamaria sp.]
MDHVKFTAMKDGDKEDYDFLTAHEIEYTRGTADRLLTALETLDDSLSGYQVTRLGRSVQSATRAWRDGADTDWVVATLLHDIGDIFAPYNHDEYAASILKSCVREQCTWVVEKHGDFQMIYYGQHVGANPHKRDAYKGHPYFDDCAAFCERWDQSSVDPDYASLSLDFFRDMVRDVFARDAYDPDVMQPGVRVPLQDAEVAAARA